MTTIGELARRGVQTIEEGRSVAEAAGLMCDHSVGALVITDGSGITPLGVITDRDLVWMIAEGLDPRESTVSQFVRTELETASVNDSLSDVTRKMREHGVRRLPIVDLERRLVGIISLDDILVVLGGELADVAAAIRGGIESERKISHPKR